MGVNQEQEQEFGDPGTGAGARLGTGPQLALVADGADEPDIELESAFVTAALAKRRRSRGMVETNQYVVYSEPDSDDDGDSGWSHVTSVYHSFRRRGSRDMPMQCRVCAPRGARAAAGQYTAHRGSVERKNQGGGDWEAGGGFGRGGPSNGDDNNTRNNHDTHGDNRSTRDDESDETRSLHHHHQRHHPRHHTYNHNHDHDHDNNNEENDDADDDGNDDDNGGAGLVAEANRTDVIDEGFDFEAIWMTLSSVFIRFCHSINIFSILLDENRFGTYAYMCVCM